MPGRVRLPVPVVTGWQRQAEVLGTRAQRGFPGFCSKEMLVLEFLSEAPPGGMGVAPQRHCMKVRLFGENTKNIQWHSEH